MMQEGAIQGWLETIDTKKKIIKDKELRCDHLEAENASLVTKNQEQGKRIKALELDLAGANGKLRDIESEISSLKRLNESIFAQKADVELQLKNEINKDKQKDERIAQLAKELANERVELSNAQNTIDEKQRQFEMAQKANLDQ